jgi:signal transduction histidine kinase
MSLPAPASFRAEIARSAAFRLTIRFAAIFVACLLVADLAIGFGARWIVRDRTIAALDATLETTQAAYATGGAGQFSEALGRLAEDDEDGEVMLGYQDPAGNLLAGSLARAAPGPELEDFVPPGNDADEGMWVRSLALPDGGWVNAAVSKERYHDVAELMLAGAIWTVAIALPLALLSGALLSRAILGRLAEIAATAESVRGGRLSQRVPVSPKGDEFDRLSVVLNRMLGTIEALTRNLRNVSVGIAHELRGPLTRVRNRLVTIDPRDPGVVEPAIQSSLAEIDATLVTFDALLKIGQIEARPPGRGLGAVDLSKLLAELAEIYRPVAAERCKGLDARIAPDIVLQGDRPLLTQMISNLVENAIEHTPDGTCIVVELSASEGAHRLVVQDDGPGIPLSETDRIFDRFYRLERAHSGHGSGLGLSLVRSICSLHGFTVRLDPTADGARFEILM